MRLLRWIVSVLAILAVALLPAIMAQAPLTAARQWTIGQLAAEGVHVATARPQAQGKRSLREIVQQAEEVGRQFGVKISPALKRAAALGVLIPVAAVVAGVCVVLSFLWLALGWNWLYRVDALVGLLACIYAIVVGWWLTEAVQAAVAQLLAQVRNGVGGLLHKLGVQIPQVAQAVGVEPQVGLYVLAILFVAMLAIPGPRRAGS